MAEHRLVLQWRDPRLDRTGTLEVGTQPDVVDVLLGGAPRVGEAALRQDPLVDAGIGVGDLLLNERAARAAGADGVTDRPVPLGHQLLGDHERLGLGHQVAVVAGVVQGVRGDSEAAAERVLEQHVGRAAHLVGGVATGAVGQDEFAVVAGVALGRVDRRGRVCQRRDLVLVADADTGLQADDERHLSAGVGRRRGDVGRRRLGIVGLQAGWHGVRRPIQELDGRRTVALLVLRPLAACPRLDLRPGEHRPADRRVGQGDPRATAVGQHRRQNAGAEIETGDQPYDTSLAGHERGRDVASVVVDPQPRRRRPRGNHDPQQDIPAGHEITPPGQHLDPDVVRSCRGSWRGSQRHQAHGQDGQQRRQRPAG